MRSVIVPILAIWCFSTCAALAQGNTQLKPPRFVDVTDAFQHVPAAPSAAPPEPAPKKPKELGSIDKWRFESCKQDAAKSPTEMGVRVGIQICRDKFEQ